MVLAFRVAFLALFIPGLFIPGLFIPGLSALAETPPAVLQGVRFGQHQAFARIVFDLQAGGAYRVVASDTPTMILLDFPSMPQLPAQTAWVAKSPLVQSVRFIAADPGVRAEIHLRQPGYVYRDFLMDTPPRLVMDIRPGHDPESAQHSPPAAAAQQPQSQQAPQASAPSPQAASQTVPATPATAPAVHASPPPPAKGSAPRAPQTQVIPLTLTPEQLLRQAEHAWANQQYDVARHAYHTFLERFPQHAQNHLIATRLADILRAQGQHRDALEAYAKVRETYAHSEGALISTIRMAELQMTASDLIPAAALEPRHLPYTEPFATLQQLIMDYPLHPLAQMARYTIGLLLLSRNDTTGALAIFHQILGRPLTATLRQEVEPKFRETLQRLMAEQIQQGEYLTALRTFFAHKGVLAPHEVMHPSLVRPLAQSYAHLGLLEEATNLLQQLLEEGRLSPENRAAITLEHAMILLQQGQTDDAKAQVAGLQDLPNDALQRQQRRVLGEIALHEQQPAEALRYWQPLADLFETVSAQAHVKARLAQAYAARGDVVQALQAWQQCAALSIQDETVPASLAEDCLFHTGQVHVAQQHYQQALPVFESLFQRFPESRYGDLSHFYMAESFRELDDEPHMLEQVRMLRDKAQDPFWKQVAKEYMQSTAWRERFQERLAAFHNALTP